MAALDFPSSSLTVGQKYPASPIAGVPTYIWDGEKWSGTTAGGSSPVGEAPNDGVIYARRNQNWVRAWLQLTRQEYNALSPPDPNVLYIIKN